MLLEVPDKADAVREFEGVGAVCGRSRVGDSVANGAVSEVECE